MRPKRAETVQPGALLLAWQPGGTWAYIHPALLPFCRERFVALLCARAQQQRERQQHADTMLHYCLRLRASMIGLELLAPP